MWVSKKDYFQINSLNTFFLNAVSEYRHTTLHLETKTVCVLTNVAHPSAFIFVTPYPTICPMPCHERSVFNFISEQLQKYSLKVERKINFLLSSSIIMKNLLSLLSVQDWQRMLQIYTHADSSSFLCPKIICMCLLKLVYSFYQIYYEKDLWYIFSCTFWMYYLNYKMLIIITEIFPLYRSVGKKSIKQTVRLISSVYINATNLAIKISLWFVFLSCFMIK